MRVAFLGLGIMGGSMAANLVKAGHEVRAWNRTPGRSLAGATLASTPAEAAAGAEVVWMCVSDTAAVEQLLFGEQGVEQALSEGMVVADSSTIAPGATREFAARVRARGADYVDAPITGSKIGAREATLLFMAGGQAATLERLQPLFRSEERRVGKECRL